MCGVHFSILGKRITYGERRHTIVWCSGAKSQLDLEPLVRHYGHSILARIVASAIFSEKVTLLNVRRERSFQRGYELEY